MPVKEYSPDQLQQTSSYIGPGATESGPAPKQADTVQAAPTGIVPWLSDAENDLRHGGGRTIVGRTLGHMQGNGEKGYSGLESGASPEAADIMGSVPLGLTRAAKGVAETGRARSMGDAWTGAKDMAGGTMQAATLPMMLDAGPVQENVMNAIPDADHAGKVFQSIAGDAKDVPLSFQKTTPELQRFQELTQRGGRNSKPFTQLSRRLDTADGAPDPVNFPEGRDFYSNISDAAHQTPLQKIMGRGMKPTMRRQAVNVRRAFNDDLTSAADQVGRGQDYTDAMKEYAQAKTLQKITRGGMLLGAGEAARRTGLLGNWIHRTALQQ